MANIRGKVYAMNVITPMKRYKTPLLKAAFKLFNIRATQWELRALSFIHFARWTSISPVAWPRFPEMTRRQTLVRDYLLFESNFNGSWNEYVDAFHSVLALKLNLVWMWSDNFPGSVPLVPFKEYIEHNQLYNDWYYMAYPGSSVSDVKNALFVLEATETLVTCSRSSDLEFEASWNEYVNAIQNKLSPNGGTGPRMT
jgi:hypothetical protein